MPRMIWPETRDVPEDEVRSWARDAQIDAKTEPGWVNYEMTDEEYDQVVRTTPLPGLSEAMKYLEDAGWVTWERRNVNA